MKKNKENLNRNRTSLREELLHTIDELDKIDRMKKAVQMLIDIYERRIIACEENLSADNYGKGYEQAWHSEAKLIGTYKLFITRLQEVYDL